MNMDFNPEPEKGKKLPAHPKSIPPEGRWSVARIFSKRAQRIIEEAQDLGCGTAMPVYKRIRYAGGQKLDVQRPLLPGYLFIRITPEDHSRIVELDGVYSLLSAGVRGSERLAVEKARMEMRAMGGAYNDIEAAPVGVRTGRTRRARPSKRVRRRLRAQRAAQAA